MSYGFVADQPTMALDSVQLEIPFIRNENLAAKKMLIKDKTIVTKANKAG